MCVSFGSGFGVFYMRRGCVHTCVGVYIQPRVPRDGRPMGGATGERRAGRMGAGDDGDARVALTHVDASSYEPVTFAPW